MKSGGVCSVCLAAKWRLHLTFQFFFSILMAPKCELYFSTRISYCKLLMQYLYFKYGVLVQDCTMLKSLITQSSFIFVCTFIYLCFIICVIVVIHLHTWLSKKTLLCSTTWPVVILCICVFGWNTRLCTNDCSFGTPSGIQFQGAVNFIDIHTYCKP